MQNNLKSLEEYYGIDIPQLLELYEEGLGREEMASQMGIGVWAVRVILGALNLRMKVKHRASDLAILKDRLREDEDDITVIEALSKDLELATQKLLKLNKSLVQARDEKNLLQKQVRELSRAEYRLDKIEELITESLISKPHVTKLASPIPNLDSEQKDGLAAIMSDWHIGEKVELDQLGEFNEYNYEIAKDRLSRYCHEILSYNRQSDNLTIFFLADALKGIIHGGLMESEGSFADSLIAYADIIYAVFSLLADNYDTLDIYVTGSNHDRVTDYIRAKDKYADYTYTIFSIVEKMLGVAGFKNINIHQSKTGFHLVEVNGENILALHGDTHRSYKAHSIPETSKLQDMCGNMYGAGFKHIVSGHTHQPEICMNTYGGLNITNGTLVGSNEYGLQNGFSFIRPSQTIFFVEETGEIEDFKQLIFE